MNTPNPSASAGASGLTDALYDAIREVLLTHRLAYTEGDDAEAFPLVDMLCPPGSKDVAKGRDEVTMICDAIYNDETFRTILAAHEAKRPSTSAEAVAWRYPWPSGIAGHRLVEKRQLHWEPEHEGEPLFLHPTDPKADPDLLRRMAEALEKARYHVLPASSVASPWGRESARLLASIDELIKEARHG